MNAASSSLLQLRDDYGRTPLALVSSALCEELQRCAEEADSALEVQCSEVRDLAFMEACSCLLSCLLLSYLLEHHIPSYEAAEPPLELSPSVAQALVSTNSEAVASNWGDSRAACLAEDLRTLMSMEQYVLQIFGGSRENFGRSEQKLSWKGQGIQLQDNPWGAGVRHLQMICKEAVAPLSPAGLSSGDSVGGLGHAGASKIALHLSSATNTRAHGRPQDTP
ncbi:hypothetical protein NFI96_002200 [Prochilodus magdalenae]|nr:hypothetical protein NFI96_002200 [Prochilodus magdalenae]